MASSKDASGLVVSQKDEGLSQMLAKVVFLAMRRSTGTGEEILVGKLQQSVEIGKRTEQKWLNHNLFRAFVVNARETWVIAVLV